MSADLQQAVNDYINSVTLLIKRQRMRKIIDLLIAVFGTIAGIPAPPPDPETATEEAMDEYAGEVPHFTYPS